MSTGPDPGTPAEAEGAAPAGRAAAFFDLDRTLVEGSSAYEFARAAARAGMLSRRQLASSAVENVRFRLQGSTDESVDLLRERIGDLIAGVRVRDLMRLGPDVLAGLLPRVYPKMLEVAWEHQDAGRPIHIATAASQELAELVAHVLGFDGAMGYRSEIVDGVYTGKPEGPYTYREGKAEAVRELAAREGYDLAECYAYSDSESDLPFLRTVGHPVAVNPDTELARIAREEGWEVLRFERLGRHMKIAAAAAAAAAVGGAGRVAAQRRAQAGTSARARAAVARQASRAKG